MGFRQDVLGTWVLIGHQNPIAGQVHPEGLSLPVEVPKAGRELTFSKISGAPKLALAVRPRQSLETGFGILWTAVWLVLGIGTAIALSRAGGGNAIRRHLPKALTAIGLIVFFLLPSPVSWCGFAVFVLGALAIGIQHRTHSSS